MNFNYLWSLNDKSCRNFSFIKITVCSCAWFICQNHAMQNANCFRQTLNTNKRLGETECSLIVKWVNYFAFLHNSRSPNCYLIELIVDKSVKYSMLVICHVLKYVIQLFACLFLREDRKYLLIKCELMKT